MKTINNKGQGNCMYYAYSISLMYYLRSEKDKAIVNSILKQFPAQQKPLQEIIDRNKNKTQLFSEADTNKIQKLLGSACRAFASKSVKDEFINKPEASQIIQTATWKITNELKKHIKLDIFEGEIVGTINENITAAELFKVKDINAAMTTYAKQIANDVERAFNQSWSELSSDLQNNYNKMVIREAIIQRKTIEFFTNDNNKFLDRYVEHLNTDTTWGSTETLATFHNSLNASSGARIHISILADGVYTDLSDHDREHTIVMNNYSNTHWVSVIPEKFLLDKPKASGKIDREVNASLDKALDKIDDIEIRSSYKDALSKMVKQMDKSGMKSNITDIDKAEAHVDPVTNKPMESDEEFAIRLQMAEIEFLSKGPR